MMVCSVTHPSLPEVKKGEEEDEEEGERKTKDKKLVM